MANDTSYGLAAAIYSKNADQVGRLMHKLKAGTVWIVSCIFYPNILLIPSIESIHYVITVSDELRCSWEEG